MEHFIFVSIYIRNILSKFLASQTTPEYRAEQLAKHNAYRAKHGSPPLILDNDLNNEAENYAHELAAKNIFERSTQYGENLWYGCNADSTKATDDWYGLYLSIMFHCRSLI